MPTETITRGAMLLALRQRIPGVSARRLGDLIDEGVPNDAPQGSPLKSVPMAFGIVLRGSLQLLADLAQQQAGGPSTRHRLFRRGEIFGMAQYAANKYAGDVELIPFAPFQATAYVAFSHAALVAFGLVGSIEGVAINLRGGSDV